MKRIVILAALIATPAFGQQQPPAIDRISAGLGQCVGNLEQRIDEIALLKQQVTKLRDDLAKAQEKPKEQDQKENPK